MRAPSILTAPIGTSRSSRAAELTGVFGAALAFYAATLAPAVIWGDSAMLSVDALSRSVSLGTAGDHPLFVLVASGFAALPGDVARNVNFAAAFFGALTVMLVYRCGRLLGASRRPPRARRHSVSRTHSGSTRSSPRCTQPTRSSSPP